MSDPVITERIGSALVIRFNRPESRSPLSVAVLSAVEAILDELTPGVGRVVFTGTGGVFASGADLREIAALNAGTARAFAQRGQRLMDRIASLAQETTGAINGPCYGGALDLALACSERIASPAATFCHPGAGLGIITGWGGTQRLPRLIGRAPALEMFFTAEAIDAPSALRLGLVSAVVADPLAYALEGTAAYV
jgi:enoyl-CoA hydratase/carnithine racemase